ncbi:MAG: class I SAM-dependent methyltransferase, partial [Planctomycetota bacterium]
YDRRNLVEAALKSVYPDADVVFKVPLAVRQREGISKKRIDEKAADREIEIKEGKMRFLVRPSGHKTGFFLDQRDTRERWSKLVRGKKVLDAFSYTGAFSIAARTLGKASRVVALDLDEEAVAQGKRNAELNRASIEWIHEDAFRYLRGQRHAVDPYDCISVDPPKWATSRGELDRATQKYIDCNAYAIAAVKTGGILVSSSCSGLVSEEAFVSFLYAAATQAGRRLQIFHLGGAAPDHPVDVHCRESRYLKVAFGRVL